MASIYILGHELQGDFFDADFVDLYEAAARRMRDQAATRERAHYNSLGEAYRAQCRLVKDYFDSVFGKGTADELFGGSNNIKEHMQAFGELVDLAQKNQKETNDFINKYTQRQNAAARHIEMKQRGNRR